MRIYPDVSYRCVTCQSLLHRVMADMLTCTNCMRTIVRPDVVDVPEVEYVALTNGAKRQGVTEVTNAILQNDPRLTQAIKSLLEPSAVFVQGK